MAVHDLFSYRKRLAEGETPDVFVYDQLPESLRVQIIHIWRDAIGRWYARTTTTTTTTRTVQNNKGWETIHNIVVREHGVLQLGRQSRIDQRCEEYLLETNSISLALDLVEVSFSYIDDVVRGLDDRIRRLRGIRITPQDAIDELNERFRRAGVGYQFEGGSIFRVDSELIHTEVVRPTLRYLNQRGFEGPRDEFLRAHAHYRAGETKDAITDANNAFESTLKVICEQRKWQFANGSRASELLKVIRRNGLLPEYLDNSFDQLAATLRSGLPKVRSEEGAHGQGAIPRETPTHVAAYALHLAAAKILFLVEANKAL